MRIALLSRRYYPQIGGVETHVKEIAENLAKKQHEVHVFTLQDDLKGPDNVLEWINGINVYRFNVRRLSYSIEFPNSKMLSAIEKFRPDVLHSHSIHTYIPYFATKVRHECKTVITPHYLGNTTSPLRKILFLLYKPYLSKALMKADRIIPTTITEKRMLMRDFPVKEEKIRIIPNGVGSDLISIIPNREKLRILSVSRLDLKHKKTDKILKAFKILESRFDDLRLILVGDGPDKQKIIELIKSLDITGKVELKSSLSRQEILQEYGQASIFVTASEMENFGIAVAEAVAAKLAVVVPNASALSLLVNDGRALGMDLPVTPEKIANRIVDCINLIKSGNEKSGTTTEFRSYTWEQVATELEKVYLEPISI